MSESNIQLDYKDVAYNSNNYIAPYRSDPVRLGGVEWTPEMDVKREVKVGQTGTSIWYYYNLTLTCRLPEHTVQFVAVAEITASTKLVQNGNFETNKFTHTVRHRYSHDNLKFSVASNFNHSFFLNYNPPDYFTLRLDMKLNLLSTFPPVVRKPECIVGPWNDVDIVLRLSAEGAEEKSVVRANKGILSMVSPFFHSLFYGPYKENGADAVELIDIAVDDFQLLLQYLYPCNRKPISATTVEPLLQLADRFVMDNVLQDCEIFLIFTKDDSIGDDYKLNLAKRYRLFTLKKICELDE